jgi:hypothetical protein
VSGAPREAYAPSDFIIVSKAAVRLLGSWETAGCFQRIAYRAERDGYWRATMKDIAEEVGVSERTAKRTTTRLREIGWLTAEREHTWDATLTWRVNFEGSGLGVPDSDSEALSDNPDITPGQSPEGPGGTLDSDSEALSGVPPTALSQSDSEALSQSDSEALSSLQTDKTTSKTSDDSLRSSSAPKSQQEPLIAVPDGPAATRNGKRGDSKSGGTASPAAAAKAPRLTAAEKAARKAQAESIARRWHDHYEAKIGPPANWPHVALRNMVERALANYTELEITKALVACGRPQPSGPAWQDALLAVRNGTSVNGGKVLGNRHHEDPASENRQARLKALEAG